MKYIDLLITDNDIALAAPGVGQEMHISDRASIAQDIVHMIRESALLLGVVGERDPEVVQLNLTRIEQMIEDDLRIVPGSAKVTRTNNETVYVTANTLEFGPVEVSL